MAEWNPGGVAVAHGATPAPRYKDEIVVTLTNRPLGFRTKSGKLARGLIYMGQSEQGSSNWELSNVPLGSRLVRIGFHQTHNLPYSELVRTIQNASVPLHLTFHADPSEEMLHSHAKMLLDASHSCSKHSGRLSAIFPTLRTFRTTHEPIRRISPGGTSYRTPFFMRVSNNYSLFSLAEVTNLMEQNLSMAYNHPSTSLRVVKVKRARNGCRVWGDIVFHTNCLLLSHVPTAGLPVIRRRPAPPPIQPFLPTPPSTAVITSYYAGFSCRTQLCMHFLRGKLVLHAHPYNTPVPQGSRSVPLTQPLWVTPGLVLTVMGVDDCGNSCTIVICLDDTCRGTAYIRVAPDSTCLQARIYDIFSKTSVSILLTFPSLI